MYTIAASTLKASLPTMAKKDVRFYLNGAYLDFRKGRIVSTDGHCLFCGKIPYADMDSLILPREAIEQSLKGLSKKSVSRLQMGLEVTPTSYKCPPNIVIIADTVRVSCTAIDAIFPEYERIVPRDASGVVAQFNPEILLRCQDALQMYLNSERVFATIAHNGQSGALICEKECFCVIMPMRGEPVIDLEWFDGKQEIQEAA